MKPVTLRSVLAGIVVVLVIAGVVMAATNRGKSGTRGASGSGAAQAVKQLPQNDVTPVTVVPVAVSSITQTMNLTGSIRSPHTANVSAASPGQVTAVLVSVGQQVTAGQVLAQLNPAQAQAQVASASQGVQAAESSYQKALAGRVLTIQQANADVGNARLGVTQAETGVAKAKAGAGAPAIEQAAAGARQAHAAAKEAADAQTRTQFLYNHGVVPLSTLEDVKTKAVQAEAGAQSADAALAQAKQGATPADMALAQEKVTQAEMGLHDAEAARSSRIAIADSDVRAALTQVGSAREQLRLARLQLGYTRVTSPLDGVVSTVNIHNGETAMPGQPLFVVTSLGNVYFDSVVSETEKLQIAPGQPATVTVTAVPGRTFTGRVLDVVPVQNPGAGGFEVRIGISTAGAVVPPGSYSRATVQTGYAPDALVIPAQAVLTDLNGDKYVFVVRGAATSAAGGGTVEAVQQPITTGLSNADRVQVVTGLQEGDRVVTAGVELLQGKKTALVAIESPQGTQQ